MTEETRITEKQWFWERPAFNNFLIAIIFVGGGIMLILAGILFVNVLLIWGGESGDLYESVRNLILSMGGVGAAIGLWFADRRQKSLSKQVQEHSKQVQVQIDQSFNEKLGRGVELLADEKNVVMRSAGVRALVDLANNATDAQKTIIANIIYDFFQDRIKIKRNNNKPLPISERAKRRDVQNALDYLTGLPLDEREKLLPNRLVNSGFTNGKLIRGRLINGALDFRNLDFSYLDFNSSLLERIDFFKSNFYETTFGMKYSDDWKVVTFSNAPPENAISYCNFTFAKIKNTIFSETGIESSYFHGIDIDLSSVAFSRVEFLEGGFSPKRGIKIPSKPPSRKKFNPRTKSVVLSKLASKLGLILPCFIGIDLGDKNFSFANNFKSHNFFKSDKFFKFYYYPKNKRPSSKADSSRGYEIIDNMNVFILPRKGLEKKDWSGQPADEWVAVEVAEWRLERVKRTEEDTTILESELAEAKENLRYAQERLKKYQAQNKSNAKPKAKKPKPKPKPKTPK